jgi:mannonate dehydratase
MKRRTFAKSMALLPLSGVSLLDNKEVKAEPKPNPSNLKIAAQFRPTDELGMILAQTLHLKHLTMWLNLKEENITNTKKQAEYYGMTIAYASQCRNWAAIVLNLPERDQAIEEFNQQTIALGKAGVPNRQIYFYTTGVLITHLVDTLGGLKARAYAANREPDLKLSYQSFNKGERQYSAEEIWDNWAYFARKVAPVAEESNVRISIHPEDPPGIKYLNEPRVIASSFDGYKQALEIADSPNIGMCLCCGCVLESGKRWGKDIIETIKYFGARNKLFKVHLRNVSSTLPEFHETWLDDGYYDMYKIMKALREVNNDCIIVADHWPGNRQQEFKKLGWYRSATYMKALLERANEEVG